MLVTHTATLLGLFHNARELAVGMMDEYTEELHCLLRNTWDKGTKESIVKELAELLGE